MFRTFDKANRALLPVNWFPGVGLDAFGVQAAVTSQLRIPPQTPSQLFRETHPSLHL